MTNDRLIQKADRRAQRRFRGMLDAHTVPDPHAEETRLYVEAERTMDRIIDARWERQKAELDALIGADIKAGLVR